MSLFTRPRAAAAVNECISSSRRIPKDERERDEEVAGSNVGMLSVLQQIGLLLANLSSTPQ
jgi:hypothetical protein